MATSTFFPPANVTTMSMSSTKWPTTEKDWEPHRSRITQLYLVEDRHLQEVMVTMERDHGFKATSGPCTFSLEVFNLTAIV
jgi:hypothetical protein